MFYQSTRNKNLHLSSAEAISQGISSDGGLFIPSEVPTLTEADLIALQDMSYQEKASFVLAKYLTDFTEAELRYCTEGAYNTRNFDSESIMELAHLFDGRYMLELWHGPTCAFKDMALQILPYLLTVSVKKLGIDKKVVILVATSGDTGKAALEGFKDVEGTSIMVFYPAHGVSAMQKLQMTTQEGSNVSVCAIDGNFDDAQTGVKKIFTDSEVLKKLDEGGMMFSSANSINWGRLVPQIVYYVSSYVELVKDGEIKMGDKLNFCVPTGNFGNILAAYYAKMMGIPVGKLICASNSNNVLTDFIRTGVYDRNRKFYTTISPSMDILISSNIERLLFLLSGGDDEYIRSLYKDLSETGRFEVSDEIKAKLKDIFYADYCNDDETKAEINSVFEKYSYTMDTHTAVAAKVYESYVQATGDMTKTVIASTASPYKFSASVLGALGSDADGADEFEMVKLLEEKCGVPAPETLASIKNKTVRFTKTVAPDKMSEAVLDFLF
ncbi:MAG: threonine synthase [Oscillospiraceae bacterium]|nr:threonine synthase [Ruminococcus sp.]MCD8345708.1 threonine synthase [Oscillospiraceae bacterium]